MLSNWIDWLFMIYNYLLFARILLSWINYDPYHPVIIWLCKITDPLLDLFRGIFPPAGVIDFSPVVLFMVLNIIIRPLVVNILISLGL
jgi:YggT family protein